MITIRMASRTDTGQRNHNEDAVAHGQARNGCYAILADGAGGHKRGAEAAQRAVACAERLLQDDSVAFSPENLTQIVRLAHNELLHHQDSTQLDARMHCTIVVLWIDHVMGHALWTHVGDSRLYRFRSGRVDVVSADDSVVQHMLRAGLIRADQVANHPQKNQLLAALGMEGDVDPHTVVRPVELCEGDAFLLCSDGWWDGFDHATLAAGLGSMAEPQQWLDAQHAAVVARGKPRQDNFSAVAVWVGQPRGEFDCTEDETQPRVQFGD